MNHADWMVAASVEYERLLALLSDLTEEEWHLPTDCTEWNVGQLVAHLVGAAEATASIREIRRQQVLGRKLRPGAPHVDGMNEVQVSERTDATPERLMTDLARAAERGVRSRQRIPAPVRMVRVPFGAPLGVRSIGYLMDRVYTRDAWLHRVDIARATDRIPVLTPEHDGRLVDDVVREWARGHRQPYQLVLTGPAGGQWVRRSDSEKLVLDAVEFCRALSGRAPGTGLLAHAVPF